jgi:hypothetical protein
LLLLLFEARSDTAHRVLADLHSAQRVGDAGYLAHGDPREVHLQDRLLDVPSHPLVALKDLRYELALPVPRHLQALYLARRGHEVSGVGAIALAAPGGCELPVAGLEMLGHLLLEDLLEDGLDAFADPGLHVPFDGLLEFFLWGQVLTSSLNPQLTRHYPRMTRGTRAASS